MNETTPKLVLVLFHSYSLAATVHSHRQHKRTSCINVLFFFSYILFHNSSTTLDKAHAHLVVQRQRSSGLHFSITPLRNSFREKDERAHFLNIFFSTVGSVPRATPLSCLNGKLNFVAWPILRSLFLSVYLTRYKPPWATGSSFTTLMRPEEFQRQMGCS